MCLIAFAYKTAALGPLVLLANRDEYYARPSAPLDWWAPEHPDTLGGRDLQAGGSWLALDKRGRFAAITNIREGLARRGERTRGELVARFVTGEDSALAFAAWLKAEHGRYAPFNLLFGQLDDLYHFHSRGARLTRLTPGIHTLSNATLDTPWPKAQRLAEALRGLPRPPSEAEAFRWLADDGMPPVEHLPNSGVGLAMEKLLAPIFIRGRDYGTRSSMLLTVAGRGDVHFSELTWSMAGREAGRRHYSLRPLQPPRRPL